MRGKPEEGVQSWNEAKFDEGGIILAKYANALDARNEERMNNWEIYAAVYSETLRVNLRPSRQRSLMQPATARNANLTFNVARSLVETEHASITEAQPRPTFLTDKGDRQQQDKARELQFAIDGIFSDLRTYATYERAEIDKCTLGTGVIKTHHINGRPAIDRVLVSEILVDEDLMGAGQDPQQVIHRQEVSRKAFKVWMKAAGVSLAALKAIDEAPALTRSGLSGSRSDLIAVYEAWSLPIDADNPGKRAIAIDNFEPFVWEGEWKSPRLPFVFLRWQRPTTGFYGIGIVEQVLGIQIEINRFYRNVSRSLRNFGVPTGLIPTLSKLNMQQWTNSPDGKFLPYDPAGGTPTLFSPQILSPEVMNWLNFQIENAYRAIGIPQNTAFAQREAGIPSAAGQREISAKAASRLAPQSREYERGMVDIAWRVDDILRELKEDGIKLVISCPDQGALHRVDLDMALSLEPGTYHIDIFAGNLLSRHPASKREELQELAKAGVFQPEEVRALISMPDVEAALGKAPDIKAIYANQINAMISKGEFKEPEAFWPKLEMGASMYADALFEGIATNVAEERLDLLRDWLKKAHDILVPPDAAAPPGAPPGPPPAPAELPPPDAMAPPQPLPQAA